MGGECLYSDLVLFSPKTTAASETKTDNCCQRAPSFLLPLNTLQ